MKSTNIQRVIPQFSYVSNMFWSNSMKKALTILILMATSSMAKGEFTLTLVHTNDAHAHYAPYDKYNTECSESMLAQGMCYGGVARVKAAVDNIRQQYPNVVFCDAGDQSKGSLWFSVYRYNITAHFMNSLRYDVMCIGDDEFGYGEEDVIRFSKAVKFPLISANLIHGKVRGAKITKSTILTINDEKFGFIGYTTKDTNFRATPGRFRFSDEVQAVREEVAVLKAQNITKIIALGQAGIKKDKEIAMYVDGVDVVIGGHTHTFLYNGPPPNEEAVDGPYPVVITQASGRKVPVVQAYAFLKYVGVLNVTFNDDGEVIRWSGNPILMDSNNPEDEMVAKELSQWKAPLEHIRQTIVGQTNVLLDHSTCRSAECNIGNVVAEGYVSHFNRHPPQGSWANTAIGITNGGSIRNSLPRGNITLGSLVNVQPFGNTIDLLKLEGRHIQEILEFSIRTSRGHGGFLQFAGLRVEYEYNDVAPNTSKVLSINVRCASCLVPSYSPLDMDQVYGVVTNQFLIRGGDGYTHFEKYGMNITFGGRIDSDTIVAYIKANSPISQGLDMRIVTRYTSNKNSTTPRSSSSPVCSSSSQTTQNYSMMGLLILLCAIYNTS